MTGREGRLRTGEALRATPAGLARGWAEAWGAILLGVIVWSLRTFVGQGLTVWIWGGAAVVAGLILSGALARIAVGQDRGATRRLGLGPAGLQMKRTELRLLGAVLLCAVFMAMILSVAALALLALFGGAGLDAEAIRLRDWAAVGPAWKLVLLALATAFALFAVVALLVRLSLFAPATVGRGHMVSLNSMAVTRGALGPLTVGLAVTAIPTWVLIALGAAGLLPGIAGWIAWAVVLNAVQAPLTMAYLGAAYRRLEPWTPLETKHG